ncbi:MAG: hypothetical protein AUH86_25440 [Acidobacteria bacterium 13_1_40CM_4_58_4]|nr:MAG: hypothetical protein AUH86_25440 [Acidobacteria bacterium 13_1_40CM_4_58_4]
MCSASLAFRIKALPLTCESCNPQGGEFPFECILDRIMLFSGVHTDYFMLKPPACPGCKTTVTEKTLVESDGGIEVNV